MTGLSGIGLGLRHGHLQAILAERQPVAWFEILVDNILDESPQLLAQLDQLRLSYDFSFHSVCMNLGSVDQPNLDHLEKIKAMTSRYQPKVVSDHLAWVGVGGRQHYDLLPLPYTKEALQVCARNVDQVQQVLGRSITVENPSSYVMVEGRDFEEWEFLNELSRKTDCGLLVDVNNIYVSCQNHGWDETVYVERLPQERVEQIHLAGYERREGYLFDSHGDFVQPPVWQLYEKVFQKWGKVPVMVEWDSEIPDFPVLLGEVEKIRKLWGEP